MGRAYEVIIPASGRWISDHELFSISDGLEPSHVNFTCFLDSCHSGGMSLEAEVKAPPMEQTLVDLIVQSSRTLIPCGSLLSPEDRVVCENNISNLRLEDGRIDLDPAPNFATVQRAKTTLISGCAANEFSYEAPEDSDINNSLMTKAILDLVNQSSFSIDHRSLVDGIGGRVATLAATLFPGEGIVQTPQLVGQDNRMGQDFLAGFTDSR